MFYCYGEHSFTMVHPKDALPYLQCKCGFVELIPGIAEKMAKDDPEADYGPLQKKDWVWIGKMTVIGTIVQAGIMHWLGLFDHLL